MEVWLDHQAKAEEHNKKINLMFYQGNIFLSFTFGEPKSAFIKQTFLVSLTPSHFWSSRLQNPKLQKPLLRSLMRPRRKLAKRRGRGRKKKSGIVLKRGIRRGRGRHKAKRQRTNPGRQLSLPNQ